MHLTVAKSATKRGVSNKLNYTWLDADGCEHDIAQGQGGEQGDPLMPALYSLAVHPALEASAANLRDGETISAFLDDTYVVAPPERVAAVHATLQEALWSHARRQLNAGKTRIWNAAGEEPPDIAHLQVQGGDTIWTGAWSLPSCQQGILVLGAPLGSEAFVQHELRRRRDSQDELLRRLPS